MTLRTSPAFSLLFAAAAVVAGAVALAALTPFWAVKVLRSTQTVELFTARSP